MISLRRADERDEARLLAWRNDPATRASAFDEGLVAPDSHRAWFARKLADPGCAILIAEEDGSPVGQVRLDRTGPELAEIDIAVAPEARGRGVGRELLRLAAREARGALGVTALRALVKPGNQASLRAFEAAGFTVTSELGSAIELRRAAG